MNPLITAIDHLLVTTTDFDTDQRHYAGLLGAAAESVVTEAGTRSAEFDAVNLSLRLQEEHSGENGLAGLCLRCDDLPRLRRRLERLGLPLAAAGEPSPAARDPASELWLAPDPGRSYHLGFTDRPAVPAAAPATGVTGLDHVVVASRDAMQTAYLFAAQLGMDLRMDLRRPDWNARLMFFRCGDTIIEVFERLSSDSQLQGSADTLYGLSWRVARAAERRDEIAALGFDVSDLRKGRKPGTKVFTIRDRCAGVATLMLEPPG